MAACVGVAKCVGAIAKKTYKTLQQDVFAMLPTIHLYQASKRTHFCLPCPKDENFQNGGPPRLTIAPCSDLKNSNVKIRVVQNPCQSRLPSKTLKLIFILKTQKNQPQNRRSPGRRHLAALKKKNFKKVPLVNPLRTCVVDTWPYFRRSAPVLFFKGNSRPGGEHCRAFHLSSGRTPSGITW